MTTRNIFIAFFVVLAFTVIAMMVTTPIPLAHATVDGDGIIEPGEDPTEELAKAAQNPVASMISLPFQNNTIVWEFPFFGQEEQDSQDKLKWVQLLSSPEK